MGYGCGMSIRLRAVARTTLAAVTPELLHGAITQRLEALTALYRPHDDEPPRQILARLRVEREGKEPFSVWRIYYSADGSYVRVQRWVGPAWEADRRELFEEVEKLDDPSAQQVRALLTDAKESVGFDLEAADARGMGWPVTMAAAAGLARASGGLIRALGEGWLEPKGNEVGSVIEIPG